MDVTRADSSRRRPRWLLRLAWVAGLYALFALAPALAPYDPTDQHRELASAPPTTPRWRHPDGRWQARPFVYALEPTASGYRHDPRRAFPIRALVQREQTGFGGGRRTVTRALGVDEPGHLFLLGTDRHGRDRLSRFLAGGRLSLAAGLLAAMLSVGLGWWLGLAAGMTGGWVDALVGAAAELFLAVPWLYLLLAARAALPLETPPTYAFLLVVGLIGIAGWARPARLVRAAVLGARRASYVEAAHGAGASWMRVVTRHVLPQTLPVVVTQAAILVPQFTLAEMTLSFFGLGVAEPAPSWGGLLAEASRDHLLDPSWPIVTPIVGVAAVFVLYQRVADDLLLFRVRS